MSENDKRLLEQAEYLFHIACDWTEIYNLVDLAQSEEVKKEIDHMSYIKMVRDEESYYD